MDLLLIAGLWLDGSVWGQVVSDLAASGHRGVALTLPGQGDGAEGATFDDQVAAVVAAVDASEGPVVVVGHSAACTLAWVAADRRPDTVAAVVLIGGVPAIDGSAYADFIEPQDGVVPFPGWGPFEGPDADDLDAAARSQLEAVMVAMPAAVTRGIVQLHDDRRYDVPVVLICPEFSPEQAREWIDGGDVPELARAKDLQLVDIDSGHWPMTSAPTELARLLAEIADRAEGAHG